jgi:O-antigen ligase
MRRDEWLGVASAFLVAVPSVLPLLYGLAGVTGSGVVTAAIWATTIVAIFGLCYREMPSLLLADFLFLSFVAWVLISFVLNLWLTDLREVILLSFTITAYLASRSTTIDQLPAIRRGFVWVAGCVALIGASLSLLYLVWQWDDDHGRPLVFGSFEATFFTGTFGFWTIALISSRLTHKKTALICALISLPAAIFAASIIRATLLAIIGSIVLAIILNKDSIQRKYLSIILAVFVLSIGLGLTVRYQKVVLFARYITETTPRKITEIDPDSAKLPIKFFAFSKTEQAPPSCSLDVDMYNSVAIRKALLRDAGFLLPRAGLTGFGLDSFMSYSCLKNLEVHNVFLQALIEFGWLGGLLIITMTLVIILPLLKIADKDINVRFLVCCLGYVVAIGLAHGRISRTIDLFALLGIAAGVIETTRYPSTLRHRHPSLKFTFVGSNEPKKK